MRFFDNVSVNCRRLVLGCCIALACSAQADARPRDRIASAPAFAAREQDEAIKRNVLTFLREHPSRKPGEGWLFLSRQYKELSRPEPALELIRTLVRSDPVPVDIKCEAQLLLSEILVDQKEFDKAQRELERMLEWNPPREYLVKGKIARARIVGRGLTRIDDLYKAFRRYYTPFPELSEMEEMPYLMGFARGYDLEIGMRALEAWEEISRFPERDSADLARLHIGLLYAYDLSKPERASPYLQAIKPPYESEAAVQSLFVRGALRQFHLPLEEPKDALEDYRAFRKATKEPLEYRICGVLLGNLLVEKLNDPAAAIEVFEELASLPPHLAPATPSISLQKREEAEDEDRWWGVLGLKMAGYTAEYKMNDPDRSKSCYERALDIHRKRRGVAVDPWLVHALARTEPKVSKAQLLFDMAYEKYRGRDVRAALKLYETFLAENPDHELVREALFRTALITDNDLRDYDTALDLYNRYLVKAVPRQSTWKLDVLYDWGRLDEVRYKIGNLLALHRKDPVGALKAWGDLSAAYPDSYWAMQGMKDSIRVYRESLGDENTAQKKMRDFILKYPDSKDAQTFRKDLAERLLGGQDYVGALEMLRAFLDHSLPSDEGYLETKAQWRDLLFRRREAELRDRMAAAGLRDRFDLYGQLIDVLTLASSSAPLEILAGEISEAEMPDEIRWGLTYDIGGALYRNYPAQSRALFERLAETSSGTTKLACLLTLGNIAYRIDKSIPKAIQLYEAAASLTEPLDPNMETPLYRLGRLYLSSGDAVRGLPALQAFLRRYPQSRHVAKASLAMGQAYLVLHHPVQAIRFFRRVVRLSPALAEEAKKGIEQAELEAGPDAWLAAQAEERRKNREAAELAAASDTQELGERPGPRATASETEALEDLEPADLYERYLSLMDDRKPDGKKAVEILTELLQRGKVPADLYGKAMRHYISWMMFRAPDAEAFATQAQKLLSERNYPEALSELLYRMAMALERMLRKYEPANKAYFEYLSFFPNGARAVEIRQRLPQVYEAADDGKNALRFYEKLIEDSSLPAEVRVDASVRKAGLLEKDEKKKEAVKTLEAALAFETPRRGEICLRLEKLTDNFDYVKNALESQGEEKFRFAALKRLVEKARKDKDEAAVRALLDGYGDIWTMPEAQLWVEKKRDELSKLGAIEEIERQIELFPEEPETPARLFRLAGLVEGREDAKYRAQDLFYEITLVYPGSEFFRESKIRAENTRAVKAVTELGDMLRKGVKGTDGEEILLERARIYGDALKDPSKAREDYEALLKLYPDSPRRDEAWLGLGEIALAQDRDASAALRLWEAGLAACTDPAARQELTRKINGLGRFRERVLYSEKRADHDAAEQQIWRIWRLERDPDYALSLLQEALSRIENRPHAARLRYLAGRLLEETGNDVGALDMYTKAWESLYHPGCRKDMVLYRMARIQARRQQTTEAYRLYSALVNRYPRSRLSRSGFYWLYKQDYAAGRLAQAHGRLTGLLDFRRLAPSHRTAIQALEKNVAAQLDIAQMERLRGLSRQGGSEFPYYIGKVLENDLRDLDRAIAQYEAYLKTHPNLSRSRDLMLKIASLYERKGNAVKAVTVLDEYLKTVEPASRNLDLLIRIGALVEDKLANPELARVFWESVKDDYRDIADVREFAVSKLKRLVEKKMAVAKKPARKAVKRVYSDDDKEILEILKDIKERFIDDLGDFTRAERELVDLWDESLDSPATLDIMKELVALCENQLMDPEKAGEYYERWLSENKGDPLYGELVMKLYDLYMEKLRDGQKALRLLEAFTREVPNSPYVDEANLKLGLANEQLVMNWDEARRIYQRIIDTKKNDPIVHEAYYRMGNVLRDGFAGYEEAIKYWEELNSQYYNNQFAADAQFAIAYTYEVYQRDYTKARAAYEKILNLYPNSPLQNQVRDALLRISGK